MIILYLTVPIQIAEAMLKRACHCRVSSRSQKNDSQKSEIRRWLKGNGFAQVEWFEDKVSGKSLKRPAFDRVSERAAFRYLSQ